MHNKAENIGCINNNTAIERENNHNIFINASIKLFICGTKFATSLI